MAEILTPDKLRTEHIGKKITLEGEPSKISEVRPYITEVIWKCPECGEKITQKVEERIIKPSKCEGVWNGKPCNNKRGFIEKDKKHVNVKEFSIGLSKADAMRIHLKGKLANMKIPENHNVIITGTLETRVRPNTIVARYFMEPEKIELKEIPTVDENIRHELGILENNEIKPSETEKTRQNIRKMMDIISNLSKNNKEVSLMQIEQEAQKDGIENPKEVIEKLKREGMIFEPQPNYIQKV